MSTADLKGQKAEAIVTSLDNIDTKLDGTIDVAIQDQHTPIVSLFFTKFIQNLIPIQQYPVGTTTIVVTANGAPVVGNVLNIESTDHIDQPIILTVTPGPGNYTIGIDTPLSDIISPTSVIHEESHNMNVNGSVTPAIFSVDMSNRLSSLAFDITQILVHLLDGSAMDDGLFGGIPSLTKGVVIRRVEGDKIHNICNIKNNGDFINTFNSGDYRSKAPAGSYAFSSTITMQTLFGTGVVSRLHAVTNDRIEILIQDDLTGLTHFNARVAGHVVLD